MRFLSSFFTVLLCSTCLMVGAMNSAEAKRLGGSQSFGGKFSYNQPVKKNSTSKDSVQRQQSAPTRQHNAERKQQLAQKGGFMGMLGALALGGLLGALFFGGAFEGINFMDVLIFGLIIFLLFKLMARRAQPATAGAYSPADLDDADNQYQERSGSEYSSNQSDEGRAIDDLRAAAPKKFEQTEFLEGAKHCFARLQDAWNKGDLADIRQFTTDHVFGEIQDQFQARSNQSQTEIVALDAELLSASELGAKQEAIVLFRAELKEDGEQHLIEEVWHFVKPQTSHQPTWLLDGIQQVEG